MRSPVEKGRLQRALAAVGGALLRAIQGKSGSGYATRFTGADEYWKQAIAAQLGWPGEVSVGARIRASRAQVDADSREVTELRVDTRQRSAVEYEPNYGWTKRQMDDYKARDSGLRAANGSKVGVHEQEIPPGFPE